MRRILTGSRWRLVSLSATLVALSLPALSSVANATSSRVVVAGLKPIPTNDAVINKVITTTFDVALTQRHQSELSAYIASLSTTSSPNYHHYLTPRQYASRYGASDAALGTVSSYLSSYGLHVGALSAGRTILHVSGTTVEIARAFDASVNTVRASNGSLNAHFTSSASLPQGIAHDVSAVAGLDTVVPESTNLKVAHAATAPSACAAAGSSSGTTPNSVGGYTVQQQALLYGFSGAWAAGDTGVGQTIGVYELANYDASDAQTFFSCYGLAPSISEINVDGGPTQGDNANNAPDEATLDLEETAALAPGATIEVYQGTNNASGPTDTYSQMASDDTATVISTSWGICESQTDGSAQAEQTIFQEMAAQGQTVVAAAGDDGSSDCQGTPTPSSGLAVDDPASQPYVTGVGGLSVTNISPLNETVWNDRCTQSDCGAGGGGVSSLWSRPAWQDAPGISAADTRRMVPDLSVMGDPATGFIQYYTGAGSGFCHNSCSGGWGAIGGTSIGAPLVSSLIADGAQACSGVTGRLGFVNPSLYAMASTGYVDVTSGNNDLFNVGQYSAATGYDMASGLGSPNGSAFLAGLCPPAISTSQSSFLLSSNVATASTPGPTINATLRNASGSPIANAQVSVSAKASGGLLSINNVYDHASVAGVASSILTSSASGALSFSVGSSIAQSVVVTVSYEGQPIYTTSLNFKASGASNRPGPPTITTLAPLVGGFTIVLRPPSTSGASPVTAYQYSIDGGRKWSAFKKGTRSLNVTTLVKHREYSVVARALNTFGASVASAAKKVVTRS